MKLPKYSGSEFSDFIKGAIDYTWIFDHKLQLLDCSNSLLTLRKETRKSLQNKPLTAILKEDKDRGELVTYQNILELGKPFKKKYTYLSKKGEQIYIELNAYKIGNGLAIVEKDVTAFSKVEERANEYEHTLSLIAKHSPDYFMLVDIKGSILFIDKLVYGSTFEQIVGSSIFNFQDKTNTAILKKCLDQVLETKQASSYEIVSKTPHGKFLNIEGKVTPIIEKGTVISFSIIARDITERKKIELALESETNRYWDLIHRTGTILFSQDKELRYTSIIDTHPEFDEQKVLGKTDQELLSYNQEDVKILNDLKHSVLKDGKSRRKDVRITINGVKYYYDLFVNALIDDNGLIDGISCISIDITDRKKAEKALMESDKWLKESEKISRTGHFTVNLVTGINFWSEEIYRIFGLDLNTPIPDISEYTRLVHEDDRLMLLKAREEASKKYTPLNIMYRIYKSDGSIRQVHALSKYEKDDKGNPFKIFGTLQDITERITRQEALKASEYRLKKAEKIAHIGYGEIDLVTGEMTWSEETFRIFGINPKDGAPDTEAYKNLIFEEDQERLDTFFNNAVEKIHPFEISYRIIHKDGSIRYVYTISEILRGNKNQPIKMFGTIHDVTDQKKIEANLKEQKEIVQKITHLIPSLIFIIDLPKKQCFYYNHASKTILGYSTEDMQKKQNEFLQSVMTPPDLSSSNTSKEITHNDLVHPDDIEGLIYFFENINNSVEDNFFDLEHRVMHSSGHWVSLHDMAVPFSRDKDGKVTKILVISNDISQIKKVNLKAKEAIFEGQEKERQRIATDLHDALNPLLSITKLNIESLKEKIGKDRKEERSRLDNAVELLQRSMKEVKEISGNLMPSVLKDFGLIRALQNLSLKISEGDTLSVNFDSHGLDSRLDKKVEIALFRIAQELLNNIIKHANATEVELQLIKHQNNVTLMIDDNGKGLQLPFHQLINKGLGFRNVKSRIKSLDGKIDVDSAKGRGTTITIKIPTLPLLMNF